MVNEQLVSNFIQKQFPEFYASDGPMFIEFMKTYYEFLEQDGQDIHDTRVFLDMMDIDKTEDSFLQHFINTYLYGVPVNLINNPRMFIKHILDVYRAKGTIRGYKLLFRLLFNEDLEVYLPGVNILKPSDSTWREPKYIEVEWTESLQQYMGTRLYGSSSGTSAVIESVTSEPFNSNIITTLYISNVIPKGADFIVGEKLGLQSDLKTANILNGPTVLGSLSSVRIISGGQNFVPGMILAVLEKDPFTNKYITTGKEGLMRVANTSQGTGSIQYDVFQGGWGYSEAPTIIQYNDLNDHNGTGANFQIGSLTDISYITYDTDMICSLQNETLNSTTFGFPSNPGANVSSQISDTLHFITNPFGTIGTLTNIYGGNGYTNAISVTIEELIYSQPLGNVSYTNTSNTITGTSTNFTQLFSPGDVIKLSTASNTTLTEFHVIGSVANDTSLNILFHPKYNSIANTKFSASKNMFIANGLQTSWIDGTLPGNNAIISGTPSVGNGVISELVSYQSGKGYNQNDILTLYLYKGITKPTILTAGNNYSNGDLVVFSGGGTAFTASGQVVTNANGSVIDVQMNSFGSSYSSVPLITVKSKSGTGVTMTTEITEYNTYSKVLGAAQLSGIGKEVGSWVSTSSLLNGDAKIQDSYYYQDFSYELRSSINFNKYKQMLKQFYHISGYEMFASYQNSIQEQAKVSIAYEGMTKVG